MRKCTRAHPTRRWPGDCRATFAPHFCNKKSDQNQWCFCVA
jgi:hypothetical protein